MKIKTSELIGPALDWAVATARGYKKIRVFGKSRPNDRGWVEVRFNPEPKATTARFDPSENWFQGGPIIERERIRIDCPWDPGPFEATCKIDGVTSWTDGPTILIAAMLKKILEGGEE